MGIKVLFSYVPSIGRPMLFLAECHLALTAKDYSDVLPLLAGVLGAA